MRVTRTLVVLLITLVWLCILAPAAGAIYIEGQQIPNDGLPHILAAGKDAAAVPASAPQAGDNGSYRFAGIAGLPSCFPAMETSVPSAAAMPVMNNGIGFDASSMIRQKVTSSMPGNRGMFDTAYFQTNMPLLSRLFIH